MPAVDPLLYGNASAVGDIVLVPLAGGWLIMVLVGLAIAGTCLVLDFVHDGNDKTKWRRF